jgi:DNA-binding transcriptional MerR regulator
MDNGVEISESGTFTIQETAERTGLSVHTLRYYERQGLIPRVPRDNGSGHRRFSAENIRGIEFLKKLRRTGMPISQMQRYVQLYYHGKSTLAERREMLVEHRCEVLRQLEELQANLAAIEYKIALYQREEVEDKSCL